MIEAFLRLFLTPLDYEVFGVIHLDSHHRHIAAQNLFRGTIDSCSVHAREVVQSVLEHRAAPGRCPRYLVSGTSAHQIRRKRARVPIGG